MQITEVRVYSKTLVKVGDYAMSAGRVADPVTTVVEVVTDSGVSGWGEVCITGPHFQPAHDGGTRAALDLIGPSVVGRDPLTIDLVRAAMDSAMLGGTEAKAAIDIACWDLLGKDTGMRVCDLLGGARSDPVPTYHVVGIAEPDAAAGEAASLLDAGIEKLQLKAGGRHIDADIASIRAVGSVMRPGTDLFVDVNRGWTTAEAIQVSRACADVRLALEQPCRTYAENAAAKPALSHPLVLDESATDLATIAQSIVSGVADGFGMKLTRVGGLSAMRAVRDLCVATNTPTSFDDSWGGDIIAAACVHIGSTMAPHLSRGAWISDPYQAGHYDDDNGPRIVEGRIPVPRGPGLGVTIPDGFFGDPIASHV